MKPSNSPVVPDVYITEWGDNFFCLKKIAVHSKIKQGHSLLSVLILSRPLLTSLCVGQWRMGCEVRREGKGGSFLHASAVVQNAEETIVGLIPGIPFRISSWNTKQKTK